MIGDEFHRLCLGGGDVNARHPESDEHLFHVQSDKEIVLEDEDRLDGRRNLTDWHYICTLGLSIFRDHKEAANRTPGGRAHLKKTCCT